MEGGAWESGAPSADEGWLATFPARLGNSSGAADAGRRTTGFRPASSQARAHSLPGRRCSKLGSPKTLSPAGHPSIGTGTGAELGTAGLSLTFRSSTAGSGGASPGRAASRKPLSPHPPRPPRRPALPVPGAP